MAREWGADVVERPAEIAGDTATSESALLHASTSSPGAGSTSASSHSCRPRLRSSTRVRSPRGCTPFGRVASTAPSPRSRPTGSRGGGTASSGIGARAVAVGHDAAHRPRRQDREPHYLETGAFYVFGADAFREAGHRFFGRIGIIEVPDHSALEIDTEAELERARRLAGLVDAAETVDVDAVVTDFDGVHTDDTVYVDEDGHEFVRVSRSDGMGVALLRARGIPFLILSTETNPVVSARARKLGVEVLQGIDDKATALAAWADAAGIPLSRIAYLGNDVNDLAASNSWAGPSLCRTRIPSSSPRRASSSTGAGGEASRPRTSSTSARRRSHPDHTWTPDQRSAR